MDILKKLMKKLILSIFILSAIALKAQSSDFNSLLQENVDKQGNVDYKSLKNNEADLDLYLNYLNKTTPSEEWSKNKEKAFWINAYNAYTIKINGYGGAGCYDAETRGLGPYHWGGRGGRACYPQPWIIYTLNQRF